MLPPTPNPVPDNARRPRRRTLMLSLALLLAGGVLSQPAAHWRLIGWWRGEAFFQGRPTSWWARQLEREEPLLPLILNYVQPPMRPAPPPPWWQPWSTGDVSLALLTSHDFAARRVLLGLLRHDNPRVRLAAVYGLESFRAVSEEAYRALDQASRDDADAEVRRTADEILRPLNRLPADHSSDDAP